LIILRLLIERNGNSAVRLSKERQRANLPSRYRAAAAIRLAGEQTQTADEKKPQLEATEQRICYKALLQIEVHKSL